jgi:DNA-directed RNA polymerase specialized sigma24 family protein
MKKTPLSVSASANLFDAIFAALPPLDSPEYLKLLETATADELPAPVLAKAFRQLAGVDGAARATLERLVASPHREQYLLVVRKLARQRVARGQYAYDDEDLFQEAMVEIVRTLPTTRGRFAETNWVTFCKHCFEDGWRNLNGRRGEKIRGERVEGVIDQESGEERDPLEVSGDDIPWYVALRESNQPWLEEFIHRTIAEFGDPLMRHIAEDQFGSDPSPISSGRLEADKSPLTEQLGIDRFRIFRLIRQSRARLFAALIAQKEKELDLDWLRNRYQGK